MSVRNPEELASLGLASSAFARTTSGISVDVFSWPYLDVSVQAVPFVRLFDSTHDAQVLLERVPPFGNPRI